MGGPESSIAIGQMTELRSRGCAPKTAGATRAITSWSWLMSRVSNALCSIRRKDGQPTHVRLSLAYRASQTIRRRIE
jgi:hypothetical protein